MNSDFSLVDWGPDEAKKDPNIGKYFFPVNGFQEIREGKIRYVIGRKGSGKTAIVEKIKTESDDNPLSFYSELSLRNFPVALFGGLQDKGYTDKSRYVNAWLFVIYVELARLVLKDNGAQPYDKIEALGLFLKRNSFDSRVGFAETITILNENNHKVSILSDWLGAEYGEKASEQSYVVVHYSKVVETLRNKLFEIHSNSEFRIFFDELDEGFKANDSRILLMILALIRAVEDSVLTTARADFQFRPLLVLRSDIYELLEDNDLNKTDDHRLKLRWSLDAAITSGDGDDEEKLMTLRNVVNSRISASIALARTNPDPWDCIAYDKDDSIPHSVESLWKYMANRTFERPRDIIKFLKLCKRHQGRGRLIYDSVSKAEQQYSEWLYGEIKDEIQSHLSVWKEALQAITKVGKGKFSFSEFKSALESDKSIVGWLEANNKDVVDIMSGLFRFGVIGNLEDRRWLFGYKDETLGFDSDMDIIVHYGLHQKLRLSKNRPEYLGYEGWN